MNAYQCYFTPAHAFHGLQQARSPGLLRLPTTSDMLEERYMDSSTERNKARGEAQVSQLVNMWTVFGLSMPSIYIFARSLEGDIKLP